jgi:hypothetical protein
VLRRMLFRWRSGIGATLVLGLLCAWPTAVDARPGHLNKPRLFQERETTLDGFFQSLFGGSGQGTEKIKTTEIRKRTVTVKERVETTRLVTPEPTEEDPDPEPEIVRESEVVTREVVVEEPVMRMMTRERGLFDNTAPGGGVGVNHFRGPVGVGADYSVLAGHEATHSVNVNVIVRKPIVLSNGTNPIEMAPYLFAGGGLQIGSETLPTAHAGGGVDVRFNQQFGLFADAKWTVHDSQQNWGSFRTGIRIVLGSAARETGGLEPTREQLGLAPPPPRVLPETTVPDAPVEISTEPTRPAGGTTRPAETPAPETTPGSDADVWSTINAIKKDTDDGSL